MISTEVPELLMEEIYVNHHSSVEVKMAPWTNSGMRSDLDFKGRK